MSLRAFFYAELPAAIEKKLAVLTKKSVSRQQLPNSFPTLLVVKAEQTNKNGKFAVLSSA